LNMWKLHLHNMENHKTMWTLHLLNMLHGFMQNCGRRKRCANNLAQTRRIEGCRSETCHNKETTQECRVYLGHVVHLCGWALPILKHKGKAIMNLNICRSEGIGRERFLHLLFRGSRNLMHTSRCKE
jgi:hypothetical protein